MNERHDQKNRGGRGDNRVWWSDFSGFPDVQLDAKHDHPVRRTSSKKMKHFWIPLLTLIVIIEIWWVWGWLAPRKKVLLLQDYSDMSALRH